VIVSTISLVLLYFLLYEPSGADEIRSPSGPVPTSYKADFGGLLGVKQNDPVKVVNSKHFDTLVSHAQDSERGRKMIDLTMNPQESQMQVLMNTWTEKSFSPVHMHKSYSEAFITVEGALALFTFSENGEKWECHIVEPKHPSPPNGAPASQNQEVAVVVEAGTYHAMTAAPKSLGYPGHAVVFEVSGHQYDGLTKTKFLAPFAPSANNGLNGDPIYFIESLMPTCTPKGERL